MCLHDNDLFICDLKVHIESLNYILSSYFESSHVLHVHFYTYIFQNRRNVCNFTNMKFIFFVYDASGYIWVCMHAYGCIGSQYRGDGVSSAQGGVCMHDLGVRVAGNFPDTSCPDLFWPNKLKTGNKHTPHSPRPA